MLDYENCNLITKLRATIEGFLQKHQYGTAVYWADKLITLSTNERRDIFLYAQTLYHTKQYHRAIALLSQKGLTKKHLACRHLAAECHYSCHEYTEALELVEVGQMGGAAFNTVTFGQCTLQEDVEDVPGIPSGKGARMGSCIELLRAKVYEAMDNRLLAAEYYRNALKLDVMCYEAFEKLVQYQLMTPEEEDQLLRSLDVGKQRDKDETELIQVLYKNKVHKFAPPLEYEMPPSLDALHDNHDVIVGLAERHYNACQYQECYVITSRILQIDPFNATCLPLHIAVLKELKKSNDLFYLAHRLVKLYARNTISWYAVGCYYLTVGKNECARRYFLKATQLDRQFGPGWIALGHAFAADKEHDQAIASYCTAAQVMKGSHIPMLYIGMEYGLSSNPTLAERFLSQAHHGCRADPFVLHELGSLAFQAKKYTIALEYFEKALDKAKSLSDQVPASYWEPLLNNMAHTCRKLGDLERALTLHERALALVPNQASTLAGIGLVLSLSGRTMEAVEQLHRSLALKSENSFASSLLSGCLNLLACNRENLPAPPKFGPPTSLPDISQKPIHDSHMMSDHMTHDVMHLPSNYGRHGNGEMTEGSLLVAPGDRTACSNDMDVSMEII